MQQHQQQTNDNDITPLTSTTTTTIIEQEPNQPKKSSSRRNKDYFVFNHFTIYHNLCAMKVGTDGVLLGGYASSLFSPSSTIANNNNNENEEKKNRTKKQLNGIPNRLLDIGCGSGLISMMLAQHYFPLGQENNSSSSSSSHNSSDVKMHLDVIDVDSDAIHQCKINLQQFSEEWRERITVHHIPIQQYSSQLSSEAANNSPSETDDGFYKYNLITCAPPYFISALTPDTHEAMLNKGGHKRKVARHLVSDCSMTLSDLFSSVRMILNPDGGRFCFIFPSRDHEQVMRDMRACGLSLVELMIIRDNPETHVIRHIYQCKVGDLPSMTQFEDKGAEESEDYSSIEFSIYTKPVPKGSKEPQTEKRRYTPEYYEMLSEFCNHMDR